MADNDYNPLDVMSYTANSAIQRGIDPGVALAFFGHESNYNPAIVGDGGSSFGGAQLHYGGINPQMPYPGLGDAFDKAYPGLSGKDPTLWRQQIDFALDNVAQHGWSDYATTRDRLGYGNYTGIGQRKAQSMASATPVDDLGSLWVGPQKNAATPNAPSNTAQPIDDLGSLWVGPTAPQVTASASGSGAGVMPTPHPITGPATPIPSLAQQAGQAGFDTLGYIGQQAAGVPGAIADAWRNGAARSALGIQQLGNGMLLPSFPSRDPSTWGAGGIANVLGGTAGQIMSPVTGLSQQLVEQPVMEATGSPEIGQRAGVVASSILAPLAGRALGASANALGNATFGGLDPETAQLADLAQTKYGIPITAPQMASGTSVMKIGSNALDRLPFSGAADARSAQMEPFGRALATEIGQPQAKSLTPSVMNAARTNTSNMFETVANNTTLHIDPQYLQDIHDVLNYANQTLTRPEAEIINRQAQNITDKIDRATKTIDGQTYLALTKHNAPLNSLMESDNSNISNAAKGLDNALDSMLARSAAPQYQDMLSTARQQWAALKTLEPLAAKASTPGQISPGALAGRVNAQTGNGMAYGWGGNLGELAQIGRRFLMEPGSSNSAERGLTYMTLAGLAGDAFRAASGGMGPQEMATTLVGIPTALTGARLANAGAKSQWLSNALINRSLNPAGTPAISPSLGLLGGGAALLNKPVNALGAPNQ